MDQMKQVKFLVYWIVCAIGLIAASAVFKNNVVLGNEKTPSSLAAVICALIITTACFFAPQIVKKIGLFPKSSIAWGVIYLIGNIIVVWVLKYFTLFLGLGISSIFFTVVLGIFLTGLQWAAASALGDTKIKK